MSKVKVKTLIGSVVTVAFFLTVIVAFLFYAFPENVASATGFGPYDGQRILTFCTILVAAMFLLGWLTEKAFDFAGKSGLYFHWGQKKAQFVAPVTNTIASEEDDDEPVFNEDAISEHLRFRYGRRWHRKVRLLLVTGNPDDVQKAAPGLCHDLWQEGDGNVLIYGGDAQSLPDEIFLSKLKRLRPGQPVDGIVQVMSTSALPTYTERDAFLRCRQKADHLLGWQAPVWLWLTDKATSAQQDAETTAAGVIFGPEGTVKEAGEAFSTLMQRLQKAGMAQVLNNPADFGLLRLSSLLRQELKASLTVLLSGLMQGSAAWRLRGVMFSPELAITGTVPNSHLDTPTWKAVIDDCEAVSARKLGFGWLKMLRLILLSLMVLWGGGTLLSLIVNRTQIYQAQETARQAADTALPLAERLHNQLVLQQSIARLQHREATSAPWYTRFGLNQDSDMLTALWPLYAKNNAQLMRDATADHLRQQLNAFVQLPPASDARAQGTQRTYDVLKSYLMLARPDKADAGWLGKSVLAAWPKRRNVPDGAWQEMAPKLLGFYAQNLPSHPEWKIKPDAELIGTVRQILLKQIGQRNAESGLYQDMLKRVASNWPDLTLADMTGDTDASTVFSTEEVVPGMFTRQAWEEQVQDAIEEVVKTRRDEIDWVLTDKTHQSGSDVSPEALKSRLTERYFTDFGNAWLNMVNSIQWHEAASLSDAIAQLNLIGDVRQSPLVALMNTLAWQGKTGEKGEALADSIVDSAKKLVGRKKNVKQFIEQAQGPRGPLDDVFGPLTGFMEGKEGTGRNGNLSFQSWLARVTQVRLKLQQVTSAPDPQAMSQMLAQTVFQGKAIDLTDTRDYSSLAAASLGQEWSGFGQSLFVQPLDLAWRQVLTPAAESLNTRWQTTIVEQWNKAFAGRYPFKATGSDASLPLLAQFLRGDSGRIATFLKTSLGGILHQEGNRWVVDPSASQGMEVSPDFLRAINQLAELSDIVFAQGDAGVHFELMARPSRDVARMQLTLDEQNLDFFNQMESWQSFTWPGNTYYPGVSLRWRSVNSGMQLYTSHQGNWGFIRLLDKALITPLDASRTQLVWITPDGNPLKFVMRSELGDGPLALLKLQGFTLPETIFTVAASVEDVE
ncbi:ImcF-related family protein [Enterobacter hormaechei]|nr:ImcF-related family protein [Enterobacter hormaechei]ARZ81307.1 type VI secretion protein VasK [Enterobacter cloacae complex sp.]KLQ49004.1 type VI secretion protein VasK [Enterobacter hormaechei subsp. steigerwaltii]KUR21667.1 type VI secretion protein VasK [Enterobacter hormaechei subsp. steigerwaltii]KVJ57812.1 type VI secretion protein VasK [Enterobacter hormaechei subsp. steigerwaltii]KZQ17506.1 type VI secretion protein VasK [Enterobacter hormaechei subsp. steigerwaltii]